MNNRMNPYNNPFATNSNARTSLIPKMPDSGIDNQLFMHMLADGTGGFVIKNTNDLFAGLQKIGKELERILRPRLHAPSSRRKEPAIAQGQSGSGRSRGSRPHGILQ